LKPYLKALVLKTSRLKETLDFFETMVGVKIEESSASHFVIYDKGIRILFVASNNDGDVELYFTQKSIDGLTVCLDPNQIKIISSPE
jgi:catechol-2,3-dioxygenase